MLDELLSYAWHDVQLLDVSVDRSNPGKSDTVRLLVEWATWMPHPVESRSWIEFSECYRLEATMNFGMVCLETIRDAWAEPDHPEIANIQALSATTDLFCWVFETNSTGSVFKIIARQVSIMPAVQ